MAEDDGTPGLLDRAAEESSSREAELLRQEIERQNHEKAVLEERHQFEILERLSESEGGASGVQGGGQGGNFRA